MVIDVIEETLEISFDGSRYTAPVGYCLKCCVATSTWSETMAEVRESGFKDEFQDHPHRLLHYLISRRCNSQRSEFSVCQRSKAGDMNPPRPFELKATIQ